MFKPCENGVMLPDNFIENTRLCPNGFRCQERNAQYWAAKRVFKVVPSEELEQEKLFLEDLVCDVESKLICLPEQNDADPLISSDNIVKTFQRPATQCKLNPCLGDKWPWLDRDGVYKCLPASESVHNCQHSPDEKDGVLQCNVLGLNSILGYLKTSKCHRNRVFIRGRCRPRFFG